MKNPPCYKCSNRCTACHTICTEYKNWCLEQDRLKKRRYLQEAVDVYMRGKYYLSRGRGIKFR